MMPQYILKGGEVMPLVHIYWWEGKNEEKKAKIMELVTKAFEEVGSNPQSVSVIIHDIPVTNWGRGGKPYSQLGVDITQFARLPDKS
jgi:4-oxalocrotonate tautomerase